MAGITSLEQAAGMKPAYPSALANVRNETLAPLDGADSTTPELVIGASEYADYKQELDRLRAIRTREVPDRMRVVELGQ
jgi:hypothetical protein